jgi:hypothetical protein
VARGEGVIVQKSTIILDTNIWSRVAEADAGARLRAVAYQAGLSIVAVPSVLYELAEMPVAASRARALKLVTESWWKRLMPEAYLEGMELIDALRLHRPGWIVERPELREFKRLEYDWSRKNAPAKRRERTANKAGTWERFRFAPEKAHLQLGQLGGADLEVARSDAKRGRQEMHQQGISGPGRLNTVVSSFIDPPVGWRGDPVAAWRAEALFAFTFYLLGRNAGPYHDWISPFVDLAGVRRHRASWTEFWLYDVTEHELSRQWVRWAFRCLSRFRRVSPGTPGDVQLSAYLYDADFVASNDKLFVEFASQCAPYAPKPVAAGVEVKANPTVVDELLHVLPKLRAS